MSLRDIFHLKRYAMKIRAKKTRTLFHKEMELSVVGKADHFCNSERAVGINLSTSGDFLK